MSEKTVTDALRASWAKKPPTVTEAVKALRIALDSTQQEFAQRLGLAISTVVRYESTRAPRGAALAKLVHLANDSGLGHIVEMFRYAINNETGLAIRTLGDELLDTEQRASELAEGRMSFRLLALFSRVAGLRLSLMDPTIKPKAKITHALHEAAGICQQIQAAIDSLPSPEQKIDFLVRTKLEQNPEMTPEDAFAEVVATFDMHDQVSTAEFESFVKQGLPPLFEIQSYTLDPPKVTAALRGQENPAQAQPKKRSVKK